MIDIDANDLPIYLDQHENVLILIHRKYCNPCLRQKEVIENLEGKLEDLGIYGIAEELNPDFIDYLDPPGYPALVLFKNGNIITRNSGLLEKTKLLDFINTGFKYE